MTSPFFASLKKHFPHAHVDAYIYGETHPMLEGHPSIDGFLFPRRGALRELGFLRAVRAARYDLAFNLTEGDRGALACIASGASKRVGIDAQGDGMFLKNRAYTHIVEHCPHPKHAVEKNYDALRILGISPSEEERELVFNVSDECIEKMRRTVGEGFILVHPVSRWLFKCFAPEKSAALVRDLQGLGRDVVLSGGPSAEEMAYMRRMEKGCEGVVSLAGQTSLKELGALIALAGVVVAPDSVPFHIANALKKPVVAYFGPSSELNWGPWRNPHARVVTKPLPCRPCYRPGCAGSRISDCLETLDSSSIVAHARALIG